MAIDSRDKRASIIGIALPPLAVFPEPKGAITGADLAQLAYAYRLVDITGYTIYLRQATDVAGIADAILPQRHRTRTRLDATTVSDRTGVTRVRQVHAIETLVLSDSVLRFVTLPGVTIIIRQATDTLAVVDALNIQRFLERVKTEAILVIDVANWTRLVEQLAAEQLTVTDAVELWRERIWAEIEGLDLVDTREIERWFTRQVTDRTSVLDEILRFYYPYAMNYEPIRGIRIGSHRLTEGHGRENVLGVLVGASRAAATAMRRDFFHARVGQTRPPFQPVVGSRIAEKRMPTIESDD